jgi:hypothetical protein
MPQYWEHSFEVNGGRDRREKPGRRPRQSVNDLAPPASGEGRHECARGVLCSAKTRDAEGGWHPALAAGPFCPADTVRVASCVAELPGLWYLAGNLAPAKGKTRVRTAPGPRILLPVAAEALKQEVSAVTAGWAARVRSVPGLQLSAPKDRPGTLGRLREDCRVLSLHTVPLLALGQGWTSRLYDLPHGKPQHLSRLTGTCRYCGRTVTRSSASGWWWAYGSPSLAAEFCEHDPGAVTEVPLSGPVPPELEEKIGENVIIRGGDGWLKVERLLGGLEAGTEILELQWRCRQATGHVPPKPDSLDGIPCRSCMEMSSLVRADPPADPRQEAMHSRCTVCGDFMDRAGYGDWVLQYNAYAKGGGKPPVCRRCELGNCKTCFWDACGCAAQGHPEARP